MIQLPTRTLSLVAALGGVLAASPAWGWHISGQVFCDSNGTHAIDAGDTPLNGVTVVITALLTSPAGNPFSTITASDGSYTKALPDHADDYKVELTSGLPPGSTVIVPTGGKYGQPPVPPIHLADNAFDGVADFLVDGCVAATPTVSATPTATGSATPGVAPATLTSSATPEVKATATTTPTATATSTVTLTPVDTPIATSTASATPPSTATVTPPPTITATPTATITATPIPHETPEGGVEAFQCYEVDRSTIGPIVALPVTDRYGTATIDLDAGKRVKRLCNPARVNSSLMPPPDDVDHLVGYVISARTPIFDPVADQTVVNAFGSIVVRAVRPVMLLVPSAKSLTEPPPPPVPVIDHFLCYAVKGGRTRIPNVNVIDQFGTTTLDIKRPSRLCAAVDKRGEGVLDPTATLLCYTVRAPRRSTPFRGPAGDVFVANQFGSDTLTVSRGRELCVPSLVNPS